MPLKSPQAIKNPDENPIEEISVAEAHPQRWRAVISWAVTAVLVFCLIAVGLWMPEQVGAEVAPAVDSQAANNGGVLSNLPNYELQATQDAIFRNTDNHTDLSAKYRTNVVDYNVDNGDSIFGISKQFDLKPESILWANEDTLSMGVDYLSVGMTLSIPPTDGVYYQWKEGDRLDAVAGKYSVTPDDILLWVSNDLDITNPVIKPGDYIMIPDGIGEYKQWVVPVVPTGKNGAVATLSGPGACSVLGYVLIGTE